MGAMLEDEKMPEMFIGYAAEVLGDTNSGLTGSKIVSETRQYAIKYDVNLPHTRYPSGVLNKRTILYDNLMAFSAEQQYLIIKELCEHESFGVRKDAKREELKVRLANRYHHFAGSQTGAEINEILISETRHWLEAYPRVLEAYNSALQKYDGRIFHRNLLDDLRLALELLLKEIFDNSKPLEKQIADVGVFIKEGGGSKEFSNMFQKLVDYFTHYQNSYVKHNSAVIEHEIEFVFEITSSFMKHLVRLSSS